MPVRLEKGTLPRETLLGGQLDRAIDLGLVDGDADDFAADEFRHLPGRSANAASHIEHFHPRSEAHEECEPVFDETLGRV
jgi:hypothetical protein